MPKGLPSKVEFYRQVPFNLLCPLRVQDSSVARVNTGSKSNTSLKDG